MIKMWDILSFNTFVTQDVLIFFYYIGAVLIPIALYFFKDYILKNVPLLQRGYDKLYSYYNHSSRNEKRTFLLLSIGIFVCMQLCWRMLFEAMIGYFDMHDYLHIISENIS